MTPPVERSSRPGATADRLLFSQVREDAEVELRALAPVLHGRVAVVSSGGCTALSLLSAGTGEVYAVDLNSTQNDLVELKVCALSALGQEAALSFLGARTSSGEERLRAYAQVRPLLSAGARSTWDSRRGDVARGVLHAGVTERFLAMVVGLVRRCVVRPTTFSRLLAAEDLATQRAVFEAEWDNRRWRALLGVLCHRRVFDSVYDEAFFASTGRRSFASHFQGVVRHGLTNLPTRDNPFAHDLLTGSYGDALPRYLTPSGARSAAEGLARLHLVDAGMGEWLDEQPEGSVDGVALSNICEWLDGPGVEGLVLSLARAVRAGGVVVLRNFVGWTDVPDSGRAHFEVDPVSEELSSSDRSLMQYRVVVLRRTSAPWAAPALEVRSALPQDAPALAALARSNPVEGATRYLVDRSRGYRSLVERLPGSRMLVATDDGEVVGACALLLHPARLGGREGVMGYAGGLVRRPGARHGGTASALVGSVLSSWDQSDAAVLTWLTNEDNPRIHRLAGRVSPPGSQVVARVEYTEVLPLLRRPLPQGWRLERGVPPEGASEVARLLDEHYRDHSLYRPLAASELLDGDLPGGGPADLRVLRDPGGRIVAAALVWDPSEVVSVVPVSLDRTSRAWGRVVGALRSLHLGVPDPPREGEPVRTLHLRRASWTTARAGRVLLAQLGNEVLERRAHTLSYVVDRRSRLPRAHALVFAYPGSLTALARTGAPETLQGLSERPVFVDVSLT